MTYDIPTDVFFIGTIIDLMDYVNSDTDLTNYKENTDRLWALLTAAEPAMTRLCNRFIDGKDVYQKEAEHTAQRLEAEQ